MTTRTLKKGDRIFTLVSDCIYEVEIQQARKNGIYYIGSPLFTAKSRENLYDTVDDAEAAAVVRFEGWLNKARRDLEKNEALLERARDGHIAVLRFNADGKRVTVHTPPFQVDEEASS